MATPMTADEMLAALKAEGLTVVELPGWRTNNRDSKGPAGPKYGTVNHHTGSDVPNDRARAYAANILFQGYSDLPGPLCQAGCGPDGTIYLVGNGRCNHAGGGDPDVLAAVRADTVPLDREMRPTRGNSNGVDGNAPFYGLEIMYSGSHPMSAEQYDATVRWNAAIDKHHGWTGASNIGHREWSSDKPDPGKASLDGLRRDINDYLAGPRAKPNTPPAKTDSTPEVPAAKKEIPDMTPQESQTLAAVAAGVWDAQQKANNAAVQSAQVLTELRDLAAVVAKLAAAGAPPASKP